MADDGPVYGWQEPPIQVAPSVVSTAGQEAIDLAARAGLILDPWQQHVLRVGMGEKPDGSWASFEVAVNVPRQNGKGGIIEARELWGLFIGGEELILHSAHEFKTAKNAFKRIERLIRQTPGWAAAAWRSCCLARARCVSAWATSSARSPTPRASRH
ncbi:hypothetical protein [Streptomyces sp. NPDC056628]|uniref:hypothetical protein n=1 Tax=Streptomyces sp. NPDC056628 TaxID=3345882 RepID=UPI00367E26DD